jgi:hypothetical protein
MYNVISVNVIWPLRKSIILNKSCYFTTVTSPAISSHIYCISIDGNVIRGVQKTILKVTSPGADDNMGSKRLK